VFAVHDELTYNARLDARYKEEQVRQNLQKTVELQVEALMSYTESLLTTAQATVTITNLGGDPNRRNELRSVRVIKAPYPSLQQIKQALGTPTKCENERDSKGAEFASWCEWSVKRPAGFLVRGARLAVETPLFIRFRFFPAPDPGVQHIEIDDFSREQIGRSPSDWGLSSSEVRSR
jgi:hypothetical protein